MESATSSVLAAFMAVIGIISLLCTALIWLLKQFWKQNNTTLRDNTAATAKLAAALDGFKDTLDREDRNREQFQSHVITVLRKISDKQDVIHTEVDTLLEGNISHFAG